MPRYAVRLAVATLVVAAAWLGVPGAAQASTCSTSHGVTVVVDFHQLGGGVQTFCDAGGAGRDGDQQMKDAGHALTPVQREPGFVCRVDEKPADDPCVNTPPSNAYWSLWWSDGKSGHWSYAASGLGSLEVPDGGYVALSWQDGDTKAPPRVTPTAHPSPSASSSPTPKPTRHPTSAPPSSSSTATAVSPTTTSTATSGHSATPLHPSQHASSSAAAAPSTSTPSAGGGQAAGAAEQTSPDPSGSSGLPGWVAPVAVVALLGAAAAVAVVRRRRTGGA